MRLASFRHAGRDGFGAVVGDRIVDLGGHHADLGAAIASGALEDMRRRAGSETPTIPLAAIEYRPVLPRPEKFVCAGYNYRARASEKAPGDFPSVFFKHATALIGHDRPMVKPRNSESFDYEGEFCLVIGTRGRHIAAADAFRHIMGYTLFNDGSVRDFQGHSVQAGKNFPQTSALGPWIVTADEIADPTRLTITTRVNGKERQRGSTADLIFDIPFLVAYVSSFMELLPGDVISTGTPAGAGWRMTPPHWLKPGDVIEIAIEGVGMLRNRVTAEA
ncbi:MAG: fumarylacetoacetate hydrolase family protein [Alphaproteobacteria bacterium]|nr:fumarylacetoacetate hydrolase family protein [Alphaproteobacteria bacterium]